MKRTLKASGMMALLSLVGVLGQGCSAEVGAPGEQADIGSTEQAIASASVVADVALTTAAAFPSSCLIDNGSSVKFLVVAGGKIDGGPTFSDKAYLYDHTASPAVWRQFSLPSNYTNGVWKAQMIVRPGHEDECIMSGGENRSGALTGIAKLKFATVGGNPGLTISNAGNLTTARIRHQMVQCGDENLAILGGGSGINLIEVWNGKLESVMFAV